MRNDDLLLVPQDRKGAIVPTYNKVHADWQDFPSTATPITAAALEQIEEGIVQASRAATQTQDGNVELATSAEMNAGTDTARVPSVKTVADYVIAATSGGGAALDPDLIAIAALTPVANDVLQYKSGAWANRTPAQLKADLSLDLVNNTSDATKWSATAELTNKTLDFDFDTTGNLIDNIPQDSVIGLAGLLNTIPAPEGIVRYVRWNGTTYGNRSDSGTIDPTEPVVWMEGPGPSITGSGSTGAIAGVDYWWRTT